MSRIDPGRLRVLPKYRTQPGGISVRSISRYAFVAGPDVDLQLHQLAARHPSDPHRQLNLLLLPWPMSVSADDFRPVPESVHNRKVEPFGYFQFDPSERLDLSLADDVFSAAKSHVDYIDIAVLPESALSEDDLPALQEVAAHHGIEMLVAGVRSGRKGGRDFTSNWVQFAAHSEAKWSHFRQEKHHRWSLDRRQIEQYQLQRTLSPEIRWWEAMEIAPRAIQLMEHPDGHTVSSLVCEDLAHMDDAVELLRSIGPTLILGLLLDGPQLASRWTSRYAGILADDPGSAVLTLSSYGMVRRSWHPGQSASSTIALWKDHNRGAQEITLAPGAHAVLLTTDCKPTLRRAADGRPPESDAAELTFVGSTQIVVPPRRRGHPSESPSARPT
jgi:hypothetical protein